ncbi:MAG: tRNA (guanosine(37)-N1)-methyltransferase TrmD [Sandaracinaceae bacterium]
MNYFVVTLFPEMVERYVSEALLGKAQAAGRIAVETITPRDFTKDRHRSVDDAPYGGGSGMLMMPGPVVDAMEEAERRADAAGTAKPTRVLLSPQGVPFTQARARELAERGALTLVCARYEGLDERARRQMDLELSLGDFVLMGGEAAALAVIEATARLVDGVLGNAASTDEESHSHGLLEYPQFTRPAEYRGETVPDVLLSGNHGKVDAWRRRQSLLRTARRRPELLAVASLSDEERRWLESHEKEETQA